MALWGTFAPHCIAESPASKNNRGNRLFEKGKFEEAEKEYLAAQGKDPGRPEILYNLGNSLIKQKKVKQGAQVLGQAISKGDKTVQEKSWYNTGNALFSADSYKDAVDAYIQALRLNPSDADAKHNLELALLKLKQQEQQKSGKDQKQDSSKSNQDKSAGGKDTSGKKQPPQQKDAGGAQQAQNRPQQSNESARRNDSINKDQAMQLLDAVQNQEKEEQRKMLERRAAAKANGKDW
jgi:Ca-activated chloride channel homolog